MTLEKIVNILGKTLGTTFILKRSPIQHKTFKGYTIYNVELYSLVDKKPMKVFTIEKVISPLMKNSIEDIIEEIFIEKLFEIYGRKDINPN